MIQEFVCQLWKTFGAVPQHENVLIPLTCQSVLGLKECTEASFHIGQTALILLSGLLLEITRRKLQLLETKETEKRPRHHVKPASSDYHTWIERTIVLVS